MSMTSLGFKSVAYICATVYSILGGASTLLRLKSAPAGRRGTDAIKGAFCGRPSLSSSSSCSSVGLRSVNESKRSTALGSRDAAFQMAVVRAGRSVVGSAHGVGLLNCDDGWAALVMIVFVVVTGTIVVTILTVLSSRFVVVAVVVFVSDVVAVLAI